MTTAPERTTRSTPPLLDYLYDVAHLAGVEPVFTVISGYRPPQTNAMLHERSSGVSSRSLHMEGRAIDVRLARRRLRGARRPGVQP